MTKKLGWRAASSVILTNVRTQSYGTRPCFALGPDFRQDDGGATDRTGAAQSSSATISVAISAGARDAPLSTVETVAHRPSRPVFAIAA